jgi:hypothetical protein
LRRKHNNTYGGNPDPALALDLDAEPERQPVIDPILASAAFERVDRGPGIVLAIKAGGK